MDIVLEKINAFLELGSYVRIFGYKVNLCEIWTNTGDGAILPEHNHLGSLITVKGSYKSETPRHITKAFLNDIIHRNSNVQFSVYDDVEGTSESYSLWKRLGAVLIGDSQFQ